MKITIVTPSTKVLGGVGVFSRDLTKIFKERGHKVVYCTIDDLTDNNPYKGYEQEVGEYFNQLNSKKRSDVVICNGEFGYAINHPKAINVFHGNYYGYAMAVREFISNEEFEWRIKRSEMQKISSQEKYVVAVSNFSVKGLNDSGIKVDQVINNSVNPSLFYPEELFLLDFTIAPVKGEEYYYEKGFDVLEKLAEKGIKIRVFSDRKIKSPNVQNHNPIKNDNLRKEYNQSLLLLQPTRFEGGSLITLEAMACGCPVITTPVGYGFDIQDHISEFVVEDVNNIGGFLDRYFVIKSKRKKFSKKARDYFLEYHNPEKFKSEWISLIEGL